MNIKGTLTRKQVEAIRAAGRVAFIMPRKKLVRVDGFQLYRLA